MRKNWKPKKKSRNKFFGNKKNSLVQINLIGEFFLRFFNTQIVEICFLRFDYTLFYLFLIFFSAAHRLMI